jgi:Na+-driven multidrug efflux pump
MKTFDTLEKATLRHIASIAWPMGLNAILMQSVIIVDVLLVASLGDISVAAFGLGGAIITFVISIQFAFGNGTQLLLSRAAGTGDIKKLGIGVASGWVLSVGFSLIATIILFFGTDSFIHLITHDNDVAKLAIEYIKISLLVIEFSSFSNVAVSYFNALKKTRIPLYGFMLEVPINIICSAMLIHGLWGAPQLGLAGAAGGSAVATALRLIYLAYQFNQEKIHGHVAGFMPINLHHCCEPFS